MKNEIDFFEYSELLKNVTRFQRFKEQHESVAGHIFGTMFIAHDLMNKFDLKVDKAHVLELLLFHDLAEAGMKFDIEAPKIAKNKDVCLQKQNSETEKIIEISQKYDKSYLFQLFTEFEEAKTRESCLANLADKFDSQNHMVQNKCAGLDCEEEFDFVIHYADKFIQFFPELEGIEKEIKKRLSACKKAFLKKK